MLQLEYEKEREREMTVRIQSLRSSAIIDWCNLATDFDAAPCFQGHSEDVGPTATSPEGMKKYGHRRGQKMSKKKTTLTGLAGSKL